MVSNKIIAITIVLVIVVASFGVYMLLPKTSSSDKVEGELLIYGNANNDDSIDHDDITVLENIISGKASTDDYPLADANKDGIIDQNDIDMVEKMINKDSMEINVITWLNGVQQDTTVHYPITSAISTGNSNFLIMYYVLNICDSIKGIYYTSSSQASIWATYPAFSGYESLGSGTFQVTTAKVAEAMKNDGVTAIIAGATTTDLNTNKTELEELGIDIIQMHSDSILDTASNLLLLGYLFQSEELSREAASFVQGVIEKVESVTDSISDSDKKTALISSMAGYVSGGTSYYTERLSLAGADNLADLIDPDKTAIKVSEDMTLVYNANPEYIICTKTMGFSTMTSDQIQSAWNERAGVFSETEAYKNGDVIVLNGDAPAFISLAYVASYLYPELYEAGWADSVMQDFAGLYLTDMLGTDFNVTEDSVMSITPDMVTV
jgi:iron complex transport system substrate-binding protein